MKKFKIEYLFYIFLGISPFLDAFSFLYHEFFPQASFSPTVILRLVIPLILLCYLFWHEKDSRKAILIGGLLFGLYAIGHLGLFAYFRTGSAYGTVFHEAQYLLNYTYMVVLLYVIWKLSKLGKIPHWKKAFSIFLFGYVLLLYLALITKTSSFTYIDGVGYKGWNSSGNAVGSLLLLTLVVLLPYFWQEKKWYYWILVLATGIYLMVFLGTKVGLFGFPLVIVIFLCSHLFGKWRKKISFQTTFFGGVIVVCSFVLLGVLILHSTNLKHQKNLEDDQNQIIDPTTQEVSHITGDALTYIQEINQKKMSYDFMSKPQQQSLVDMKKMADFFQIDNSNRRMQQLFYHTALVKNQRSVLRLLFGNGYLANYSEMTLEMELVSLLYNFGIIGFFLYLGVFFAIEIAIIKNFKKKNKNDGMYFVLFGILLVYGLSLLAGYTFFHVSCMIVIVLLHISALESCEIKNSRKKKAVSLFEKVLF